MEINGKGRSRELRLTGEFRDNALRRAKELGFQKRGRPNLSAYIRFLVAKDTISISREMVHLTAEERNDLLDMIDELAAYHLAINNNSLYRTKLMLTKMGLNVLQVDQSLQRARIIAAKYKKK